MNPTVDAELSLTSLSVPTRERCSQLVPRGWFGLHRQEFGLGLCAIVLSLIAGALGVHSLIMGIGFVLCIALVCVVLAWPVVGGLVLIALVPSLSGLEPGILVPNVRLSEALIGVVGLTILLATRRVAAVRWGLLEWLLLAYGLLWAALGLYNAVTLGQHLSLSEWGTLIGQLQFFLLYRTVRVTLRTPRLRKAGVTVLLIASAPMALLAILQEANVAGLRLSLWTITGSTSPLESSGIIRATGLYGNWAALAGFLFPIIVVLIALALAGQLKQRRAFTLCLGALMVIGLVLTAELSVIICLILGVFVLGVQYGQFRKMITWFGIAVAVSLCVLGPVIGQRLNNQFGFVAGSARGSLVPQTIAFRETIWTQQYLPAVAERPLEGYGNVLPDTVAWPYPESQYIGLLVEGGYPLLIMYLLLLWGMFDQARRTARLEDPIQRALGRALMVCVVSLVALGVTWPFVSNGGLPQVLWCLFGLAGPVSSRLDRHAPTPRDAAVRARGRTLAART